MMDPGIMFSEERLVEVTNQVACADGTRIVFNRIINILLEKLNNLQPEELDHEYLLQTTLNYEDYEKLLNYKKVQDCASLHAISDILTKFLHESDLRRPREQILLGSMEYQGVFTILLIVALSSWIIRLCGYGQVKSTIAAITLVGFVQFLRQQQYESNIGILFVRYFTELTFLPIGPFLDNVGVGTGKYLSHFMGFNWFIATPIFSLILIAIVIVILGIFSILMNALKKPTTSYRVRQITSSSPTKSLRVRNR